MKNLRGSKDPLICYNLSFLVKPIQSYILCYRKPYEMNRELSNKLLYGIASTDINRVQYKILKIGLLC
jgi:hypothetical protein